MVVDMLDETVRVFAHLEEIGFLFGRLHFPPAVRAPAIHQLGLCKKGLAGSTVEPLICALIDISLFIKLPENFLHLFFMVFIRCTDKMVI